MVATHVSHKGKMIITAMYLYAIIQGEWNFETGAIVSAFLGDLVLVSAFGDDIGEKIKRVEK